MGKLITIVISTDLKEPLINTLAQSLGYKSVVTVGVPDSKDPSVINYVEEQNPESKESFVLARLEKNILDQYATSLVQEETKIKTEQAKTRVETELQLLKTAIEEI